MENLTMDNDFLTTSEGNFFKKKKTLPIDTIFKLPVPISNSSWPPGGDFIRGIIDLGGLQVSQISTFNKVWGTYGGGPDNKGFIMFEPSGIPQGSFSVYDVRPSNRGIQAPSVRVGTFVAQNGSTINPPSIACPSISCLKTNNAIPKHMPNLQQIKAILQVYSPIMCLHPDEKYLPSSMNWFFSNGALLYKKGQESNPVTIAPNGTNLPQDHNTDGAYWLDLLVDASNKEKVKKGDLQSAKSYVHVKPMLGGFTDIAIWVFYPFNGPSRAKVKFITL
uniref:Uncharacterized protein n=1 Tax=Cajanus cajan TaxID=3821 RepID=A0A151TWK3_CAJCA|nr:hypothetical protein KK1_010699 [Cajanus cajan]